MTDIMPLFKTLADEERLRVAAVVSTRAATLPEIADAVALAPPAVTRHLTLLREVGLVEVERQGERTVYRFCRQPLLDTMRAVNEAPAEPDLPDDIEEYDRKVLRDFLVDGRLKTIPAQLKKRDAVLRFLVTQFEPRRTYAEKEVNAILGAYHDDVATLRRALVDARLMARDKGIYRRAVPSAACSEATGTLKE